jgi:acetyl-CoA C-acetyltransferase
MKRVVITSYARTPLSSQNGREFLQVSIPELALIPFKAAIKRSGLGRSDIDGVIMGQMSSGTGEAMNLARHVALKAELDYETACGYTVNRVCGSGFTAVINNMTDMWIGESNVCVAAGCEMNSHQLVSLPLSFSWTGIPRGGIVLGGRDYQGDPCTPIDVFGVIPSMGFTADKAARLYGVTREDSDQFAYDSQMKAKKAQESGRFDAEIVPVEVKTADKKGKITAVFYDRDMHLKPHSTLEVMRTLPPVFDKEGTVTAGSASGSVDGAAAIVLMTEEEAVRRELQPIAYVNAFAYAGVDPTVMGIGPAPAILKLLKKTGLTLDEIGVLEINEAFAAQVLACLKIFTQELGADHYIGSPLYERLNPNGGAVAIGHPEGCTGVRLTMTVAEELRRTGKRFGICSACIGGGMGVAILLENTTN